MLPPLKPSPTPYVFAIRAQERASIFEREGDYMRCLAVEDQDEMKNWVLSIRCTKVTRALYKNRIRSNNNGIFYIFRVVFNINIIPTEW